MAGERGTKLTAMAEILNLNALLAQLVLALGAGLVVGNAAAIWTHLWGKKPKNAAGPFRAGRAWFLLAVGVLIGVWGLASLVG